MTNAQLEIVAGSFLATPGLPRLERFWTSDVWWARGGSSLAVQGAHCREFVALRLKGVGTGWVSAGMPRPDKNIQREADDMMPDTHLYADKSARSDATALAFRDESSRTNSLDVNAPPCGKCPTHDINCQEVQPVKRVSLVSMSQPVESKAQLPLS